MSQAQGELSAAIIEANRQKAISQLQSRQRTKPSQKNTEPSSTSYAAASINYNAIQSLAQADKHRVIAAESTSPTVIRTASTQSSRDAQHFRIVAAEAAGSRFNDRLHDVRDASAAQKAAIAALPRDSRLGDYIEFDLSKTKNSRGGFLIEENAGSGNGKTALEVEQEKRREQQRVQASLNAPPLTYFTLDEMPKCSMCSSIDIDPVFHRVFKVLICPTCKNENPERFSLLTKTECKEDYLLTDPELRDEKVMPHLLKANPHKLTWNNMMLYMRGQVEDFAFKKWGGSDGLDAEFDKRQIERKRKRGKKFEAKLLDLKKRTKGSVWQTRLDAEHKHDWQEPFKDSDGMEVQTCSSCGFQIKSESFD